MSSNKKGFTLVELLAVIVILAIILAIAVPGISGLIGNTRKGAFESDVKMIITGIEYKVLEASLNDGITLPSEGSNITSSIDEYGADPNNYSSVTIVSYDPVTISVTSKADSKFGAWTATNATRSSVTVQSVE